MPLSVSSFRLQSLIFTTENQIELALEVARPLLSNDRPSPEAILHTPSPTPSPSPSDSPIVPFTRGPTFNVKLRAELDEQYWIHSLMQKRVFSSSHGSGSWYMDKNSGRITAMHPDWQWKMMLRCLVPNWEDFEFENLPMGGAMGSGGAEGDGERYPVGRTWWKVLANRLGMGTVPKVTAKQAGMKEYDV